MTVTPADDHRTADLFHAPDGQRGRLCEVFDRQVAAFRRNPMPTLAQRLAHLDAIRRMVRSHRELFREALAADFGTHHPWVSDTVEMGWPLDRVRHLEQQLPYWLVPRDVPLESVHGSSTAELILVPKGVNGIISPWSTPIGSALVVAADVVAAGNPVIIRPSELAPASAQVLHEAVSACFDPSVMAVVPGDDVAEFAGLRWAHLTFLGNARVGRSVAEVAARKLVPITLQLSGKNPAVFAPDGVTHELVKRFLSFRTTKAGQLSSAPDHVFVPRDQLELFLGLAEGIWRTVYPQHVGHADAFGIIDEQHYRRVLGHLDEARARGVTVIGLNDDVADAVRRQIPMTLVVDPPADLACMTDDVSGPVIPVVPYDDFDEVIERINGGPSPLAAYLATFERERMDQFVARVRCGSVGINTFGLQSVHPALANGGIGASGHGAHSGREGFLNYSHTKSVYRAGTDSVLHMAMAMPLSELAGHVADTMFTDPVAPPVP